MCRYEADRDYFQLRIRNICRKPNISKRPISITKLNTIFAPTGSME